MLWLLNLIPWNQIPWNQIFGLVCGCLFSDQNYIHMMEANLDALQKAMRELEDKRDDLLRRVTIEEDKGLQRLAQVEGWLKRVETVGAQVNNLLEARSTETERLCLFGYCSDSCITSYEYGKEVLKRLEEVKELLSKGDFDVLAQKIPVPKVVKSAISINEIVKEVQKTPAHSSNTVENAVENAGQRQTFMIYAKQLKIEWSELASCWTFMSVHEEPNGEAIEVAKLNEVWYLHVSGFFHTKVLTPETRYEVVFVVKVEDGLSGWDSPAKLELNVPHGNEPQVQELSFDGYIRNTWVDIRAGVFVAPLQSKKITFTLSQHENDERKTGLQIKGVSIRPMQ